MANARDVTKRGWRYFWSWLWNRQNTTEDRKIQLEQAFAQGLERKKRITASAANIIASQKAAERELTRLETLKGELEAKAKAGITVMNRYLGEGNQSKALEIRENLRTISEQHAQTLEDIAAQTIVAQQALQASEDAQALAQEQARQFEADHRKGLQALSQIDRTNMLREITASADEFEGLLGSSNSLSQVTARIQQEADVAEAQVQLSSKLSGRLATLEIEAEMRAQESDSFLKGLGMPELVATPLPRAALEQGEK